MDGRRAIINYQRSVSSFQQLAQSFAAGYETLRSLAQIQQTLRSIVAGNEKLIYWRWVERASARSGFLPYRAVPFDEFFRESTGNYDLFSSRVSKYYELHQEDILQSIESYLETLEDIDVDRKATIQEAIVAPQTRPVSSHFSSITPRH